MPIICSKSLRTRAIMSAWLCVRNSCAFSSSRVAMPVTP